MPTCATCTTTFEVSAANAEKFPGWTPKVCPACFRASKGGASNAGDDRKRRGRGNQGRGGSARGSSLREENLTVAEVLQKYRDGPQDGVFTDGSASPNPGPGGWGAVYVVDGEVIDRAHGAEPHTTNNRMELAALAAGIDLVPAGTAATVYSDSRLVVDTLTKWAAGWERRGWKRKSGPIANLDLVKPLYAAVRDRPELRIEWIAAHSGNRWNEYADSLSTAYLRDTV